MKTAVIIPTAENRIENLIQNLDHLENQTVKVPLVVIVCDGPFSHKVIDAISPWEFYESNIETIKILEAPKHVAGSGTLQPKNYGAAFVDRHYNDITHLWFLDSDIIVEKSALEAYIEAHFIEVGIDRILIGPYEWLPANERKINPDIHNDPRTQMFEDYNIEYTSVGEINFALANFGGNIVYPLEAFKRVGGFWDDLSAGRVEDGEMGLRCASMGIPMAVVPDARGYHLHHSVNHSWKVKTNKKEVPMINQRHPWVQQEGLIVVEKDGKRFDWINPDTGESVNTLEIWNYKRDKINE
jgi:GT2 family glycosyltransferase